MNADTWEQMQAYESATNPWLWVLGLSAAVIVISTIGALFQAAHRPAVAGAGLAALSVTMTTAWLAVDAALLLGLLD